MSKITQRLKTYLLNLINRFGVLSKCYLPDATLSIEVGKDSNCEASAMYRNSNTILRIKKDGKGYYFKECRPHVEKKAFIELLNKDYILFSHNEMVPEIQSIRKLYLMGSLSSEYSNISRFFSKKDYRLIGLNIPADEKQELLYCDYAKFIWSEIYNYKLNSDIRKRQFQTYNASRSVAFYEVAKLLGLERLIPETRYCELKGYGEFSRLGALMNEASGVHFDKVALMDRRGMIHPLLQRDLGDLHILDILCYEKDHRPDNNNVILNEEQKVVSINAFDNDSPMSFFLSSNVRFHSYEGCSPLVESNGSYNRPFVDIDVYERLLSLKKNELYDSLLPFLTKRQVAFVWKRAQKLANSIKKATSAGRCKFLRSDEWTKATVEKELSGQYGFTYLSLFASDWVNPNHDYSLQGGEDEL